MSEKKLNKKLIIIVSVIAAVALIATVAVIVMLSHRETVGDVLDLGDRYMSELDYESAIREYKRAIEIDPKAEDAYLKLAEAYIAAGDVDSAIEALEDGYAATQSERMLARLDELRGGADSGAHSPEDAESIVMASTPQRTTYNVGDALDLTGLTLTVTYQDGATEVVRDGYTCEVEMLDEAGTQEVTVRYGGAETKFTVTVEDVAETEPVETEPAETEPPVTEPPVTDPLVTEKVETEPVMTEPPVIEPPVIEPPVTGPSVTEPPVTELPETEHVETEPPVTESLVTEQSESFYQPDLECPYNGYVGVGIGAGKAYFDYMRVIDQGTDMTIFNTDFENATEFPEFHALGATDAVVPTWVDCPVQTLNEEEITNHAIEISKSSTYMCGEINWNYYRYRVRLMPADNDTVINIYFAVTDENNYYVLTLGENGNTQVTCYKVNDGKKENAQFTIAYTVAIDKYTSVGITLNRNFIDIYIDGMCYLEIGNDALTNDYYPYIGTAEPVPLSVIDKSTAYIAHPFGGAPGENVDVVYVDPENVIHDGLGTWSNDLTHIATMAFDHDLTTFYDADANREYPKDVEGELPGISGNKTDENGYVGAYFPKGINLYAVRYCPRNDGTGTGRMDGGTFEASTDGVSWTVFHTINEPQSEYTWHTALVGNQVDGPVNYVRYHSPSGGYCNIAEIEIWVTK